MALLYIERIVENFYFHVGRNHNCLRLRRGGSDNFRGFHSMPVL
jgi:hypothetical protein